MRTAGANQNTQAVSPGKFLFELPDAVADHSLLRCIGSGSYGKVYLARNELTGSFRALKVVFRDAFRDARPYQREFEAICRFEPISRSHPGFVQILQVGKLENAFYYIMELADDASGRPGLDPESYKPRTLALNRGQVLPIEKCIEIGSALADCLSVLHANNLIHRDIKPSNIIFVNGHPKLADIGLVVQIDEANSMVGTAGFMPPEGPVGPGSDIYSLGKVLYEISTGKDRCEFPQLPSDITTESTLHLELNQILLRACDPKPERRYATAKDLRRELELLHAGKSIKRLRQVERRLHVVRMAFVASVAVGIAGFVMYQRFQAKIEAAERERQRQAGSLLAQGTVEMRNGYLSHALPFFVQAAELDARDPRSHQLRIGSVLALAPTLVSTWNSGPRAEFSENGEFLALARSNRVEILEATTGRVVETHDLPQETPLVKISPDLTQIGAASGETLYIVQRGSGDNVAHRFENQILDFAFRPYDNVVALSFTNFTGVFLDAESGHTEPMPGEWRIRSLNFDSSGHRLITCFGKIGEQGLAQIRDGHTGEVLGRTYELRYPYKAAFTADNRVAVIAAWGSAVPLHVESGELAGDVMDSDDAIVHCAFSEDGSVFATASYDGSVRLWEVPSFNALRLNHILDHPSRPERVAFIGKDIVVARCTDGMVYVWRLGENKLNPVEIPQKPKSNPLIIEKQNASLAAHGATLTGEIKGRPVEIEFPSEISALAISPDLEAVAIGSKDSLFEITQARLYRLNDLEHPVELRHRDGINYITFSHGGNKLVTCSEDFTAAIWDRNGRQVGKSMRHRWQVVWASFSSDDKWIATVGWDDMCIVWDSTTGEPLTIPMRLPGALEEVEFEPGDSSVIVRARYSMFRLSLPFAELPFSQYTSRFETPLNTIRTATQSVDVRESPPR
jgi:WD40 repeat protein